MRNNKKGLIKQLLKHRTILISGPVQSEMAREVISLILFLDKEEDSPICVYINSPGGEVYSGFAIFDIMKTVKSKIITIVTGLAASMGSILALGADPNCRYALPNAMFLIHQPLISGIYRGTATDIKIQANEMVNTKDRIIGIYMNSTGKSYDEIKKDINRDFWLSSKDALMYGKMGLIDKIVNSLNDDIKI